MREFVETFAYQFQHGANAERTSGSKDLFYHLFDTLKESKLDMRSELGGHSPVWAMRAQREGCQAFIAAQNTEVISRDLVINKNLLWPNEKIDEKMKDWKQKEDLHMVFEYQEGDVILGGRFRAPRSNRFYFVHDPNGGKFMQMEIYHNFI